MSGWFGCAVRNAASGARISIAAYVVGVLSSIGHVTIYVIDFRVSKKNSIRPGQAIHNWAVAPRQVLAACPGTNGRRSPRYRRVARFLADPSRAPATSQAPRDLSKRLVDYLVDDPLDLVALEGEDDLARRRVHGVPGEAASCQVERRPALEQHTGLFLSARLQPRYKERVAAGCLDCRGEETEPTGEELSLGCRRSAYDEHIAVRTFR
jgi:hypothetical protein